MKDHSKLSKINEEAFQLSSGIKLLSNISWPAKVEQEFLSNYKRGKKQLPAIQYQKVSYQDQRTALNNLLKSFTASDPLEVFTQKNIESYIATIDLVHSIGTTEFTDLSIKNFGVPSQVLPSSKATILSAATQLVDLATDFSVPFQTEPTVDIDATEIKQYMERRILGVFKGDGPKVEIADELAAKATATTRLIKLRAGPSFSKYDFKQLFYHEVMTHSLTALNGENQPILKCMGRGTIRTLKTQEGLATFSEVITGSMDIHRLKRLALRILGVDMAIKGANFLEVFEFFLAKGQSDTESYAAAHRIFRGGFPDKNIIFTKDCIYLEGLIEIHTFFRWAMKHNKIELCFLLFCGRLNLDDIFSLEEAYKYQWITPPKYLPAWLAKTEGLAGSLGFSILANLVRIDITNKNFYNAA